MTTLPQSTIERPAASHALGPALRITLLTILAFAGAAALIAWIALKPGLLLLGALVAFFMMLMIGMPLILASIADAVEGAEH